MAKTTQRQRWAHLESLRYRNGLNQRALAERLGISAVYMSQLESGARRVTPELLVKMAGVLDTPVDELEASRPHVTYPTPKLQRHLDRRTRGKEVA